MIKPLTKIDAPTFTMLIGAPASGKSTWTQKNAKSNDIIISRDNIVDKLRVGTGMSYSDTFKDKLFQSKVNTKLEREIDNAFRSSSNIIVDMTNMSKKSRSRLLSRAGEYKTIGVAFEVNKSTLIKRLDKRFKETGKFISIDVINNIYTYKFACFFIIMRAVI
jgi:predicted kinase